MKEHENYRELIWTLAKTEFKLRYHGSVLGYVWAILKPLLTFAILNFVFSSIFNMRNNGTEFYSLGLLVSLMMYYFFAEGTSAGLTSLISKSQLVNKIYVPRWAIIIASTINSLLCYVMNLIVIVLFFIGFGFMPSLSSILLFVLFSFFTYILILSFSLIAAPLYVKFRDLSMIWDVFLMIIMYASPIIYPLSILPVEYHRIILLNPFAFIAHFTKESLLNNHFADVHQYILFVIIVICGFTMSLFLYKKLIKNIAEDI